jgi:hypothetical protein
MRRRRKPSLVCSLLFWIPLVSLWNLVQQLQLQQGPPHGRTIDSHKIIDRNDSDSLHRRKKSLQSYPWDQDFLNDFVKHINTHEAENTTRTVFELFMEKD